jgi:hemoglobin
VIQPVELYRAIGGAAGCHALASAFYSHVARDPILRPLFPSTFTCAIEEFSAFLVQFLGGETEATQRRWWLSLRESHSRFPIGAHERTAWLRAMTAALSEHSLIADADARHELLEFFKHSSAHVVNEGEIPAVAPLAGELAPHWKEQVALDEVVALLRLPNSSDRCLALLESPILRARFVRSPAVHASVLSLVAKAKIPALRGYALNELRAHPSLIHRHYSGWRTLLHDAAGSGNLPLVELLFDLGAADVALDENSRPLLYCVGNECSGSEGGRMVRVLLERTKADVNEVYGVKACTALHMAARRGNVHVIEALLDAGANIECRDSLGDTPLRRAVNCNKVAAAKLLLARGADPHSKGSKALTPDRAARSLEMKQLFGKLTEPRL